MKESTKKHRLYMQKDTLATTNLLPESGNGTSRHPLHTFRRETHVEAEAHPRRCCAYPCRQPRIRRHQRRCRNLRRRNALHNDPGRRQCRYLSEHGPDMPRHLPGTNRDQIRPHFEGSDARHFEQRGHPPARQGTRLQLPQRTFRKAVRQCLRPRERCRYDQQYYDRWRRWHGLPGNWISRRSSLSGRRRLGDQLVVRGLADLRQAHRGDG